jgi:hypothetical protein
MKQNTIFAILLIAIGIISFSYQGITYKTRKKTVDLGSVHVTTEKTNTIPLPPILGAITLIGGILLLIKNARSI